MLTAKATIRAVSPSLISRKDHHELAPRVRTARRHRTSAIIRNDMGGDSSVAERPVVERKINGSAQTQPAPSTTKPINWEQQWYPIAIIDDLDPTKPHPTTLLNKNLVLWYDGTTWNAFLDRCPHRLAALSEGRVEDNKLQCAYHGYEFASSGACVRVPHAADAKSHANALASPRSCAQVYPAKVSSRLLWVWGDPQTPGLAASSAPAFESDTSDALMFARMLPYDFETLLENAFDPGHIPFAHHGPLGSRNSMSFGLYSLKPVDVPSPLSLGAQYRNIQGIETLLTYHFPCVVQYVGQTSTTTVISIPVRPGTCKLITIFQPAKFSWIMKFIPTWVAHALSGLEVLDGDAVFMHQLEHDLVQEANTNGATWKTLYWMPTSADTLVARFRQLYNDPNVGNGGPWGPNRYASWGPRITDRRVLLDRYDSHTKHCKACSTAHARLGLLHTVSKWTSAVAAAATTMAALLWVRGGVPVGAVEVALLAALSLAAFAIARKAQQAQQALVFKDYVHAEK